MSSTSWGRDEKGKLKLGRRGHVPILLGVLPHARRQRLCDARDAESPISIADVPSARVTRRLLAHELSEGYAEGRDHLIDLSLVHHRSSSSARGARNFTLCGDESVGAARRLRLRRSESGRGGARIGSARRKRDGSRADEAQRARDGHAVRARRARTMRRRKTKSGSTTTDDERERAQAETRAAQKRTREVVGVTRMQVEMVGTPRGVPLACSRGASGVPSA